MEKDSFWIPMYVNASQAFMLNQRKIAICQKRFHALNAPKDVKLAMVSIYFFEFEKNLIFISLKFYKIDTESKFLKF